MPRLHNRSWVAAPPDEAFAFFDDPRNLPRLMPPFPPIRVLRVEPDPPRVGSEFEFRYGLGPLGGTWVVHIVEHEPGRAFADDTVRGPMRRFRHEHRFTPARGRRGGTWVEDRIDYHVGPDGPLGAVLDALAGLVMRAAFLYRAARQRRLLVPVPMPTTHVASGDTK